MTFDLAVVGGTVVGPKASRAQDIGVRAGKIAAVSEPGKLAQAAAQTVDASGTLVLPGAVDVHTHLDAEMFGASTADDFYSGTAAAAAGGVTTIVDYAFQSAGGTLREGVERWHEKARDKAIVDYGFHIAALDPSDKAIAELPGLVADGYTSFKIFMMLNFEDRVRDFLRFFRAAGEHGALLTIHCEDENLIGYCTERLLAEGHLDVRYFSASRPPLSEAAAVTRALAMAEMTGAPAYLVHLSSAAAMAEVRRARAARKIVAAETRPIYLYLTEERYLEPKGERYVGFPPLRAKTDLDALWQGLADGTIDAVGTDHCSWHLARKTAADRFNRIVPGMSNLETLLPMLYSEGVAKGRLRAERMVELLATNPAKIFGLYPRKGEILEGADADLVIFDPNKTVTVRASEMHSRADYDPFEGFEVHGWPRMTIARGEVIAREREMLGRPGRGRFIARAPFSDDWRVRPQA